MFDCCTTFANLGSHSAAQGRSQKQISRDPVGTGPRSATLGRKSSNHSVIPRSVATRNLLLREEDKQQIPRFALHHTVRGFARNDRLG